VSLGFTYMGTKHRIADQVANVVASQGDGPVLDLFSGVSALGRELVGERPIWCNDIQHFAFNVSAALFTSGNDTRLEPRQISVCRAYFDTNFSALSEWMNGDLSTEDQVIAANDQIALGDLCRKFVSRCEGKANISLRLDLSRASSKYPYRLFTITYAGGYIGVRQAMEIDSIRYAIDQLAVSGAIDCEARRWLIVALCHTMFRISNSTGHFAQYLKMKPNNAYRFLLNRRRSAWEIWCESFHSLIPLGKKEWRATNRVYCEEATSLLENFLEQGERPAVIYADPPYTADHYSRYYHLLETLILYDYPEISSKGQYRPGRYYSQFSIKTKVQAAFAELISTAAKLESTIVISYPEHGLLTNPKDFLTSLLRSHYRKSGVAAEISHQHSSLGASKGHEKSPVTEIVYVGRI
jgi:adenine-specific DNA-methyltransferase